MEGAAIPGYSKLEKMHLPRMGYSDILPKYANATAGEILSEYSRKAIENAYQRAIGDARNQYTLGYTTRATPSGSYRQIEVRVDRPGCKIIGLASLRPGICQGWVLSFAHRSLEPLVLNTQNTGVSSSNRSNLPVTRGPVV